MFVYFMIAYRSSESNGREEIYNKLLRRISLSPPAGFPHVTGERKLEAECGGAAFAALSHRLEVREHGHRLQRYDKYGEPVYCHRCEIDEPRLSSSAFWKNRGELTSYSDSIGCSSMTNTASPSIVPAVRSTSRV